MRDFMKLPFESDDDFLIGATKLEISREATGEVCVCLYIWTDTHEFLIGGFNAFHVEVYNVYGGMRDEAPRISEGFRDSIQMLEFLDGFLDLLGYDVGNDEET